MMITMAMLMMYMDGILLVEKMAATYTRILMKVQEYIGSFMKNTGIIFLTPIT